MRAARVRCAESGIAIDAPRVAIDVAFNEALTAWKGAAIVETGATRMSGIRSAALGGRIGFDGTARRIHGTAGLFVWHDRDAPARWQGFRPPATPDDIRQIEEIALAEIRAARPAATTEDPAVEIARRFGIRRVSGPARQRIEAALALEPQ